MSKRKAIFLDRDGVINRSILQGGKPYAPRTLADFQLLPRVQEAVFDLAAAEYLIFVATNQPDIGNGLVEESMVHAMHEKLLKTLPITKIYMCPHAQQAGCACRKPKPSMLLAARDEYGVDMENSFMIGDRYSDICAGNSAGCQTIFIDYDYVETPDFDGTMRVKSLFEARSYILTGVYL